MFTPYFETKRTSIVDILRGREQVVTDIEEVVDEYASKINSCKAACESDIDCSI